MRSGKNTKSASTSAGILTLNRLLTIRARREQSLRRSIAEHCNEQLELEARIERSRAERQKLCQQLRELTQWCGLLAPREFSEQKNQLHLIYQQERGQQAQITQYLEENKQLAIKVEALRTLLQRNLLEQEKLRILIKDESNRY
ncbi:hypothetical protein Rin_00001690 [Candidatus Regiella insecticola 5.15]|uniref:Type III secretion system apparatus protein n=1 Tax=Candidatus Regiella insecticola 5.15 TaxID=1005043 RepID=G2GWN4_9ENTR|nr:hypothetical protein Rin_00001690 [Candidatus Regiella insecticola 5.15]